MTKFGFAVVLVRFLDWMMHAGQKDAAALNYAPLPKEVVAKEDDALRRITTTDGKRLLTR